MRAIYKQLEDRIAELEQRVKELEAQLREQHTHLHSYPPVYLQPVQSVAPTPSTFPSPFVSDMAPFPDINWTIAWDGGQQ